MGQGSGEYDLLGEFITIFATWSSVTGEKVEKVGGGISGEMCWGVKLTLKVSFLYFVSEKLNKSISQKLRGVDRWEQLGR